MTAAAGSLPRDALIFVPGIGRSWTDQSLEVTARRIADSLDRLTSGRGNPTFTVGETERIALRADQTQTRIARIFRRDGETSTPVLDLYEFDYRKALTGRFEESPVLWQAIEALLGLVRGALFLRGLFTPLRRAKTVNERFQLLFFFVVLFLYAALLVILITGLAATVMATVVPAIEAQRAAAVAQQAAAESASAAVGTGASGRRWRRRRQRRERRRRPARRGSIGW